MSRFLAEIGGWASRLAEYSLASPLDMLEWRLQEVDAVCCAGGNGVCVEGVPESCPYRCGRVWTTFFEDCQPVLSRLFDNVDQLEQFTTSCLNVDPVSVTMALYQAECSVCGDGITGGIVEQCDNGSANSDSPNSGCRTNCMLPKCGDGIVDDGEECDDMVRSAPDGGHHAQCCPDCQAPKLPLISVDVVNGESIVFGGTASYVGEVQGNPSIVEGPTGERDTILFGDASDILFLGAAGVDTDGTWTIDCQFKTPVPHTGSWHTLTRGFTSEHHVIINEGETTMGSYLDRIGFISGGIDMSSLSDGWHRLTVAADGSATTFYVDSVQAGSYPQASESDFYAVGNFQGSTAQNPQNWGYMRHLRIYDGAFAPADLEQGCA